MHEHPARSLTALSAGPYHRLRRSLVFVALLILAGNTGCFTASLATSTGPRVKGAWSVAREQQAHVGEEVLFDVVLAQPGAVQPTHPESIADYCILTIGDGRLVTTPRDDGHFSCAYRFDREEPGTVYQIEATLYRVAGMRDPIDAAGDWRAAMDREDDADTRVASDSVKMTVYQSRVELRVSAPAGEMDFASGRLQLRRSDGSATTVYQDRPRRAGFKLSGPTDRQYSVLYEPRVSEINVIGETEAELVVYDSGGERYLVTEMFPTP